ncbi:hypothetical protein FB645_000702 [Coemansia sp. IMI 203386]|nr:hypothetical protein IWW45_005045 [Coemansia sp. RSA 485]KAJ2707525.1 hypothetical protein FB645_000702 [Coemansia sp. IMI 203386]
MPTTPLPASVRKRTELFAKNIKHRGNVKKSLDPKKQQAIEAQRQRKNGLGSSLPSLTTGSRKIIIAFLALTVGSVLYQICLPFIGGNSNSGASPRQAKQSGSALTREQQARAAEAVLQELNRKATEKYFSMAKNYKPPAPPVVVNQEDNAGVDDFVDFEDAARKFVLDNHGEDDDMPFDAANNAQGPMV